MKKIVLSLFCIFLLCFLVACNQNPEEKKDADIFNNDSYTLELAFSDDYANATLSEKVTFINRYGNDISDINFNLYLNSYMEGCQNPAYFDELDKYGGIEVNNIMIDNNKVDYVLSEDKTLLSLNLAEPLKAGEQTEMCFDCTLSVPVSDLCCGYNESVLTLGNFYPILCVYEQGKWDDGGYSRIGAKTYSDIADYDVTITCKDDICIVPGEGLVKVGKNNGQISTNIIANDIRSFGFCASPDFKVSSCRVGNILLSNYYIGKNHSEDNFNTLKDAIAVFSDKIGEFPYSSYNVVETDCYYSSVEYSGLSIIDSGSAEIDQNMLKSCTAQWFGQSVGSNSLQTPWVEESLTSYLSNYYYRCVGDKTKYSSKICTEKTEYIGFRNAKLKTDEDYSLVIAKTNKEFGSNYDYKMIVSNKGVLMYDAIVELIGEKKFDKGLKAYYQNRKNSIATSSDLPGFLGEAGKQDVTKLMSLWLEDKVVIAE